MAQKVGYFEDNVEFLEGPFVVVYVFGFRIESELVGHHCPVHPDISIFRKMVELGWKGKSGNEQLAHDMCDILNELVKNDEIVCNCNGMWVMKDEKYHNNDMYGW